ncbi:MAG: PhoPQ-activated protein PqaA family protein [Parachlamydiaceae bacterium]
MIYPLIYFCIVLLTAYSPLFSTPFSTPLDNYVKAPDPHYQWKLIDKTTTDQAQIFTLQLTSQKWRSENEVDKPLWVHELLVVVPKQLEFKTAIMAIGGGISNVNTGNAYAEISLEKMAMQTHAIACELTLIPNQALKFPDEWDERYLKVGRREDALVAYTWDKYLKTEEADWLLRLPMTKAVVKGMDAVEEMLKQQLNLQLDGFILTGKSKRGWTAWTAAAVDTRVKGIIPVVIDLLNLKKSFTRHYMAYGNWSPAVQDYLDIKLDDRWEAPSFKKLIDIVEPFSYQERFTMPKYIINATGDEFFLPDSSQLYWKELPGAKHLLYLPNVGHRVTPDVYEDTVFGYLQTLLSGKQLPSYHWEKTKDNTLIVKSAVKPEAAYLWYAENSSGRDFRIHTIGTAWKKSELKQNADGTYTIELKTPEKGWNAHYIEMVYLSPGGLPLRVSTDLVVLPEHFPFKFKTGKL